MLYLASNSPRRKELLRLTGLDFRLFPVDADETPLPGELPANYVLRLAESKARLADQRVKQEDLPPGIILSADTAVVDRDSAENEVILGKPASPEDAVQMLRRLRGRTHTVYTALGALRQQDNRLLTDLCTTRVHMRDYTEEELQAYVASGDPLDKAGAYAIQHPGFRPVVDFSGCYAGVMGLPLCHLVRLLARLGLEPKTDAADACQRSHDYACPVAEAVLRGEDVG